MVLKCDISDTEAKRTKVQATSYCSVVLLFHNKIWMEQNGKISVFTGMSFLSKSFENLMLTEVTAGKFDISYYS